MQSSGRTLSHESTTPQTDPDVKVSDEETYNNNENDAKSTKQQPAAAAASKHALTHSLGPTTSTAAPQAGVLSFVGWD